MKWVVTGNGHFHCLGPADRQPHSPSTHMSIATCQLLIRAPRSFGQQHSVSNTWHEPLGRIGTLGNRECSGNTAYPPLLWVITSAELLARRPARGFLFSTADLANNSLTGIPPSVNPVKPAPGMRWPTPTCTRMAPWTIAAAEATLAWPRILDEVLGRDTNVA